MWQTCPQNVANLRTNVHSKWMYIQNKSTFKMNVHSKRIYIWHNNDHVCHILCVIATLWIDCHILIIIATLWACLPYFEYYCHTVAMLATFCLWLPLCGHVCHILSTIATLWQCLPLFVYNCHSVGMFATFWVILPQIYIQNKFKFKTNVNSKQMFIQNECTFKMNVP